MSDFSRDAIPVARLSFLPLGSPALNRDVRLDLLRGYAMLAIALNHISLLLEPLGFTQQNVPTLTSFGYSSSAAIFFALSGYMLGLITLRRPAASRAIWKRIKLIYVVNAAAFLGGMLIVAVQPTRLQESLNYSVIYESPGLGLALFFAMLRQPALLDVLHMYVILMVATPAMAILLTRRPLVALLVSAGIYTGALLFPSFDFPAAALGPGGQWHLRSNWNMEMLSWQLLFFASMVGGTLKLHQRIFAWLEAHPAWRLAIIGLFLLVAFVRAGEQLELWGSPPLVDKHNLEPLRLLHAGLTLLMLSSLLVLLGPYLNHPLAHLVALVGRQTLYAFAATIPASYVAAGVWAASGGGYAGYLLACAFVLTVLIAVSLVMEARSARRQGPLSAE
jgi:hypothetical protein